MSKFILGDCMDPETGIIYHESCLNTMSRLKDKSIDLVVTSPPYNMRTRIRNGKYTELEKSDHFSKKYKHFDDALPIHEFYELHSLILYELLRISKVVCYNIQLVTGSKEAFLKMIGDFNLSIKDIIIWDKGNGVPAMHEQVMNSCYELVLVMEGDNKAGRVINAARFERGRMDNIIRARSTKSKIDGHRAVFPNKLVARLISAFSSENDLIYDPFCGSGTTGEVCHLLNRRWIMSEITEDYYNAAKKRMEQVLAQTRLF